MSDAAPAPAIHYVPPGVRTCYHEAGHAVMAHIAGQRFRSVHFTPTKPVSKGRVMLSDTKVNLKDRAAVEETIMILLAGEAADSIVIGHQGVAFAEEAGNESDVEQALGLAVRIAYTQEEATAHVLFLRLRTVNLLSQPQYWAAVKALSGELMHQKRIGVRKTKAIIEAAMLEPLSPVAGDWHWRRNA